MCNFTMSNDASLASEHNSDFYRQLVKAITKEKNEVLVSRFKEKIRHLTQHHQRIQSTRRAYINYKNEQTSNIQISISQKILEIEQRHERYQKNIFNKRKHLHRKVRRLLFEIYGEYQNSQKRFQIRDDYNRRKFDQDVYKIQRKREQYKWNSRIEHDFQTKIQDMNKLNCHDSCTSTSNETDLVGSCLEKIKLSRDDYDDVNCIENQFSGLIDIRPITWLLDSYDWKMQRMAEELKMGITQCTYSMFESRVYFCLEEFMDEGLPKQSLFKNDIKQTQNNLTYSDWVNRAQDHLQELYAISKLSKMEKECLTNKMCIPLEKKCNLHRCQNQRHPNDICLKNFPDVLKCKVDSSRHVHFAAATLMQLYQTGILCSSLTNPYNKDDEIYPERSKKPPTKHLYVAITTGKRKDNAKTEKNKFQTILVKLSTSMLRELAIHFHTSFILANSIHKHVHSQSIFRDTSFQIDSDTISQNHDLLCKNITPPRICAWKTCGATAIGTKKRIFCNYHSNVIKITDTYQIDSSQKYILTGYNERSCSSETDPLMYQLHASSLLKELLNNSLQISLQEFFKSQLK